MSFSNGYTSLRNYQRHSALIFRHIDNSETAVTDKPYTLPNWYRDIRRQPERWRRFAPHYAIHPGRYYRLRTVCLYYPTSLRVYHGLPCNAYPSLTTTSLSRYNSYAWRPLITSPQTVTPYANTTPSAKLSKMVTWCMGIATWRKEDVDAVSSV